MSQSYLADFHIDSPIENMYNERQLNNIGLPTHSHLFNFFEPENNNYPSVFNQQSYLANTPYSQNDLLKAEANYYNTLNKSLSDYQNSWQYKYLKPASELVSTASSLGNIFLGMKQYNLAKEQLGMAREKWDLTKQELSRIKNLRNKLTTQYMGK